MKSRLVSFMSYKLRRSEVDYNPGRMKTREAQAHGRGKHNAQEGFQETERDR
jgi:hypothetical protein